MALEKCLPMDGVTVVGVLCIVATVCKAVTLGSDALASIRKILETLEEHFCIDFQSVTVIPNKPKYNVEIVENRIKLRQIKTIFDKLGLNYGRSE